MLKAIVSILRRHRRHRGRDCVPRQPAAGCVTWRRELVIVGAPVDVVFGTITDFESHPSWRPDVKSVTVMNDPSEWPQARDGRVVDRDHDDGSGPGLSGRRRLVMRIVGEDLPYGGSLGVHP